MPRYDLPHDLERIYGPIGFADRVLYSNFVSSLDGVVTLGSVASAGSIISGRNQADRFLMGLLRACADAVLLGAGTLRATPGHHWTPEHIYPSMAGTFADLRSSLRRQAEPRLVLFTSSGHVDVSHPAVVGGATIVTTRAGAANLKRHLPASCDVVEVGEKGDVDVTAALEQLHARGFEVLLTEGGPHLVADFIEAGVLDEAFLTLSPVIAGRDREARHGMVAGVELLPSRQIWSELTSARRHGDFLFLRYDLRKRANP
ncbi:MAG TPA: dihydrofolate reductase family protein [Candidatus Dormibacteraeota bacterium]|nr:dihydrofolate reductase family protein [Candidatus Dormibacteraeota bacterium]